MNKFFLISILLLLSACSDFSKFTTANEPIMPVSGLTTNFVRKDFYIKGRVRGEYTKTCFLFNLICTNDIFIFDDLKQQAKTLDAYEVIDVVVDRQTSSWIWFFLYSRQTYRANGLAVNFVPPREYKK